MPGRNGSSGVVSSVWPCGFSCACAVMAKVVIARNAASTKNSLILVFGIAGFLRSTAASLLSVLETAHTALEFILDNAGPQPLDHPGVVVAVRQVMVQG